MAVEPVFITAVLLNEDFDVITDVLLYVVEPLNEEATWDVLNVFRYPEAQKRLYSPYYSRWLLVTDHRDFFLVNFNSFSHNNKA
jgi:hypothetical protein